MKARLERRVKVDEALLLGAWQAVPPGDRELTDF